MSMTHLAREIATSRLHHKAAYLSGAHSDVIADLREIAQFDLSTFKTLFEIRKAEIVSAYGFQPVESNKPFAYADGVAIIPIHGLLVNRLSWSCSFATGYNFIRSQRLAAMADPDVELIVYDVNSPGGVASGCAELAEEMYQSRGEKPSLAVVDSRCFSAAYFLASAADRIVVTPTGGVGSIGCVVMHIDFSGMLAENGIKITFIDEPEGGEKVDGNPYQALSPRAIESIRSDVAYHYGLFTEAVAKNRGISQDDVRQTQAACFVPPEALGLGLIDGIETPADAVANFFNDLTSDTDDEDGVMDMAQQNQNGGAAPATAAAAPVATAPAMTQADIDRAVASALSRDRARQAGIRTAPEAKGREALADHLAMNTEMSVDEAKAVLSAAPKIEEKTEGGNKPAASGFSGAMSTTQNPEVRPDGSGDGVDQQADTAEARAGRLLGAYGKASGQVIDLKAVRTA